MGLLDIILGRQVQVALPTVLAIMPPEAVAEIQNGRLPQLNSNNIFLKNGELCHYIDKAILLKEKVQKSYVRKGGGYSMPGFFKGTRVHMNNGRTDMKENVITEQFRGILYITNKRTIFQANKNAFDKPHTGLTALAPYSNAIELQYGEKTYSLLVPNGGIISAVMDLLH
ncbi:hypothetical protein FACS1894167_06750 [Synergistales bacterium]|nr:hypothetical protein FACS1894167_06750 [Synergistales bacterium]